MMHNNTISHLSITNEGYFPFGAALGFGGGGAGGGTFAPAGIGIFSVVCGMLPSLASRSLFVVIGHRNPVVRLKICSGVCLCQCEQLLFDGQATREVFRLSLRSPLHHRMPAPNYLGLIEPARIHVLPLHLAIDEQ